MAAIPSDCRTRPDVVPVNSAATAGCTSAVSIILPTYNRASFLPQAFQSIQSQEFADWSLIIVDDGSTDDSRGLVRQLSLELSQPVFYVYQENQGPYAARNTGLDHATGQYVAFFDSDDLWLPHHLRDCVKALEQNPDVDGVYGACRIVDHASGDVVAPTTFYVAGIPRPFMRLEARHVGSLHIIEDRKAIPCIIKHGHFCGLQNSVFRRCVFEHERFVARRGHESEDRLAIVRVLVAGHKLAYFDNVHVIYHVHQGNSSAPGTGCDPDKRLLIMNELVKGRERLRRELVLTRAERRALDWRISCDLFWGIGYNLLWQHGRYREAVDYYWRALSRWPWSAKYWKTFILAVVRTVVIPDGSRR